MNLEDQVSQLEAELAKSKRLTRRLMISLCFSVLTLQCVGCATIINGSTQKVPITSDPNGATVDIDGKTQATTPTTVALKRNRDHVLTFSKEGYETTSVAMNRAISGAVAGNLLAGGLIGWGVDAVSGAQNKFVSSTVHIKLNPIAQTLAVAAAPVTTTPAQELAQHLRDLKKMKDDGLITEQEYQALRAKATGATSVATQPAAQPGDLPTSASAIP